MSQLKVHKVAKRPDFFPDRGWRIGRTECGQRWTIGLRDCKAILVTERWRRVTCLACRRKQGRAAPQPATSKPNGRR